VPLACGAIAALMALIIRLEVDRDDQNLSYAVTIRQRVATKGFIEENLAFERSEQTRPVDRSSTELVDLA